MTINRKLSTTFDYQPAEACLLFTKPVVKKRVHLVWTSWSLRGPGPSGVLRSSQSPAPSSGLPRELVVWISRAPLPPPLHHRQRRRTQKLCSFWFPSLNVDCSSCSMSPVVCPRARHCPHCVDGLNATSRFGGLVM